jgi:hypothetical protein
MNSWQLCQSVIVAEQGKGRSPGKGPALDLPI